MPSCSLLLRLDPFLLKHLIITESNIWRQSQSPPWVTSNPQVNLRLESVFLNKFMYIHVTFYFLNYASFPCCCPIPEVQARASEPDPTRDMVNKRRISFLNFEQLEDFLKQANAGEFKIPKSNKTLNFRCLKFLDYITYLILFYFIIK